MFNPVGKYINSYPDDSLFQNPSGMAIDVLQRQVFITDSKASKIFIYSY